MLECQQKRLFHVHSQAMIFKQTPTNHHKSFTHCFSVCMCCCCSGHLRHMWTFLFTFLVHLIVLLLFRPFETHVNFFVHFSGAPNWGWDMKQKKVTFLLKHAWKKQELSLRGSQFNASSKHSAQTHESNSEWICKTCMLQGVRASVLLSQREGERQFRCKTTNFIKNDDIVQTSATCNSHENLLQIVPKLSPKQKRTHQWLLHLNAATSCVPLNAFLSQRHTKN